VKTPDPDWHTGFDISSDSLADEPIIVSSDIDISSDSLADEPIIVSSDSDESIIYISSDEDSMK
jgi:hypothetical protein